MRNAFAIRSDDSDWVADLNRCTPVEKRFLENAFAIHLQRYDSPIIFHNRHPLGCLQPQGNSLFPPDLIGEPPREEVSAPKSNTKMASAGL
jgi:hypothetical protein